MSASLSTWWSALASRERALLQLTLVVVLGALVWWVGLAPALRTVRAAPAQLETLDQQWLAMQNLAAQARSLQARSRMPCGSWKPRCNSAWGVPARSAATPTAPR